METIDSDDVDPRRVRSRQRLLDAAVTLLNSGGVEAVTVEAVTRLSRVARTTLYRHFESSTDLVAAAFERLLPQAETPETTTSIRDDLLKLMQRQAELIEQAPLQLTTLAWLAMLPEQPRQSGQSDGDQNALAPLRRRVVEQYREPFDRVLTSDVATAELGDLDLTMAVTQLAGPLVFAKLTGIRSMTVGDLEQLVDDFLMAHRRHQTS
ncbi:MULTISPECIES: TetR/AcrR family transcriptional regulator [Gordonia]|uniref:AcrR family transcriptional regulator n=9 Tax=Gordonia TaxID=2053 RepID=A0A840F2H4_9ACTN|nr:MULTISPECIES: TetR/AcrR family transcriptional regulator [Gordonia]MBB4138101.1 AcrR family transcriptional regulator [Gordonia humi]NLE79912.1 TetR/AcrR family transcriptional regulator [Rhodococcus sp. (in: high G+C Gram-positive bacteria)]ALG86795.1 TetR family transcriptional regulator [Gordonia phthalatica]ALG87050.1 TetR family transcriptional regulator [Gordonia phthalatica]AUH70159.1 TetR/AcrR family transcriptional regulator [Gordonia sp. YC-JH1]